MGFGHDLLDTQVCTSVLDRGQRIGLAFIALASLVSLLAILLFFSLYLRNLIRSIRTSTDGSWKFFSTDIDSYFLSLLLADTLLSVGGLMNIKWIIIGHASCGHFCSAQGAVQQLGAPGVALSNIAISLHTFFVIFFNWNTRSWLVPAAVNLFQWAYLLLLVFIGWLVHQSSTVNFFSPTPYWCWIDKRFVVERLIGDYVYPWLASLLLLLTYGLLFLRLRGWVMASPDQWSRIRLVRRVSSNPLSQTETGHSRNDLGECEIGTTVGRREASKMLWYPICYIILVLPMSIVRWIHFANEDSPPPFVATAIVATLFKLSGLVNVVLYMQTRPNLLLFRGQSSARRSGVQPPISRSASRIEDPRSATEEIFQLEELRTSGSPNLYSASTLGSFAAMQQQTPLQTTNPQAFDVPGLQFKPLDINIPSSRLSNIFSILDKVQRENLRASLTMSAMSAYRKEISPPSSSRLPMNEAAYVAIEREEREEMPSDARSQMPQFRPSGPVRASATTSSSADEAQPRIHSLSPAWDETVRDILDRDDGAKAAFEAAAGTSNIRASTIKRVRLKRDDELGRGTRRRRKGELEERWTFPVQSPVFQVTFQGAHPRHSQHPQMSSTAAEEEAEEVGEQALQSPLSPTPTLYHLPARAQKKRPTLSQSSYFRRSVMPPSSYKAPRLSEEQTTLIGSFDKTLASPSTSSSTSLGRSPKFSSPRTAYTSSTLTSPADESYASPSKPIDSADTSQRPRSSSSKRAASGKYTLSLK